MNGFAPGREISRRAWLVGTAAFAWGAHGMANATEEREHPWIDAHSHIWTRDVQKYPLANGNTVDDLAPPSFTTEELLAVAHRSGVGRVVLIQHYPYHGWDNSYVIDAAQQHPDAFRVVACIDNLAPKPGERMRSLLRKHVTGFRITPSTYGKDWMGGGMEEMWRTAADTGQNICFLVNPENLPEVDDWCQRFPNTPVVIDHFARIGIDGQIRQSDLDALCRIARHKLVKVKLSAYYALGAKKPPYTDLVPMIRRLLDAYGVERLMWASDSPYQLVGDNSYPASLALITDHLDFLSNSDREHLLQTTAQRTFFASR